MKLEVGHIFINDIQFASESKIENGVLYVDEEAVKAIVLEDEKIKGVKFDIAKPGESVRITPVKDVIEPRVKVEGRGGVFPGVIAKVDTVGSGKTYALKGMAVVTAGKIVGFQEGIIDMSGPGAEYTPFSKLNNLVVVCEPVEGIKQHEYEKAVRLAGFRVAVYLGELARELTPDETKVYETYGIMEGKEKFPNLPRVAYVQMLQSQGLLHDTYVYGVDAKRTLSTIMNPTEVMPDITKPAGAGDVPLANYKMIAALAVKRGELDRKELASFAGEHGLTGWAPTQGHIPSGVPYIGFAREDILAGKINKAMIIGKGSLFLGRMTNLFDGVSFVIQANTGAEDNSGVSEEEVKGLIAKAMKDFAASLMATEE